MGGVESYMEGLASILSPSADVYVLCVLPELASRVQRHGVKTIQIPVFSKLRILRFLIALIVLPYLVLRHRIGVVQINGFLEAILLIPARLLNCYTIYTRHGPFETELYKWYRNPGKLVPRSLSRYGARLASRLVCVSETVGEVCKPLFPSARVTVIPNWVAHIPDYRARSSHSGRAVEIIYVGRLERYKGLHLLLEALRSLEKVHLTVLGDGAYRQELEEQARGLDVTFVGFQRDPRPFYEIADIFVMPSLGPEGLPLVALEAMAHSLPCLFSDLPVHREITQNATAALLFRSGDAHDLRRKLISLIANGSTREEYGRYAHQRVKSKYDVSTARRAYLDLFNVTG